MAEHFNLARRLSARNEHDFVQEDFGDNGPFMNREYCINLVEKVCPSSPLPSECQKYPDVMTSLRRRDSDRHDQSIAFSGMHPGEKAAAMAARDKGRIHQAQVKRRLTSTHDRHTSWWA